MPLEVEILRRDPKAHPNSKGEPLMIWNDPNSFRFVSYMYTAAIQESAPDWEYQDGKKIGDLEDGQWVDFSWAPIYYLHIPGCALVERGKQKLKRDHTFPDLELKRGDVLHAWRSYKQ